ncbi:hypothetical protein [Celeribacter sp.]|uniref:hypothetical protein n=1 Tax=Celeribacter sp. TaxID=1890673 RepID=UPI003A8F5510
MSAPIYAMVASLSLKLMTLADLRRLVMGLPEEFRPPELVLKGRLKAPLIAAVEAAKSAYWNAQPAARWHKPRSRFCELPASEVNAFLRALPPTPPAGGWPHA